METALDRYQPGLFGGITGQLDRCLSGFGTALAEKELSVLDRHDLGQLLGQRNIGIIIGNTNANMDQVL